MSKTDDFHFNEDETKHDTNEIVSFLKSNISLVLSETMKFIQHFSLHNIIHIIIHLDIQCDIEKSKHLFNSNIYPDIKCDKVTECVKMQVICAILRGYQTFITQQQQEEGKSDRENYELDEMILEFYEEGKEKIGLVNDFNHLLTCHSSEFEDVYNLLVARIYDGKPCDLKQCESIKKNQRDRNKECTDLYHSTENNEIVLQQLLDRIHCYFLHTFDIGYKTTKEEIENIIKQAQMQSSTTNKHLYRT